MALAGPITQQNFAAGMFRVAPHLLPKNAAWRLPNMLLNDDGSAYRRGGTVAESNAPLGTGLRFVWDGELAGGHRTVFASTGSLGILDVDGETPVDFGVGGLAAPSRAAVIDGLLFIGAYAYGGSRKLVGYNTGTVTVVQGDTTVVGAGTAWAGALDTGMVLTIDGHLVAVKTVTDDGSLELVNPWGAPDAAGLAYSADPVAQIPGGYHPHGIYGVSGGRLLSGDGDRVYEAQGGDSSVHDETEYHQLPGGEVVRAIEGLADLAYVFASGGIWAITNTPYDLTDDLGDSQQQLQRVSGDIVLWDAAGVAFWQDTIVVPALDGVWLIGPGSGPELLTASITPLYVEYVQQGYTLGQACVYHGHYFLPVLSGGQVITLLVCRLDRPVDIYGFGRVFGWTDWSGAGARVAALAARTIGTPVLLGAEYAGSARVLRMPTFIPDGEASDHDGSSYEWGLVSRDYATGPLNVNFVKKVQVRYELVSRDATAQLVGGYGTDERPTRASWGTMLWGADLWSDEDDPGFNVLAGAAPEDLGDTPFRWRINKKTRYLRVRVLSSDPCTRGVIRSIEVFVRPSGRMYG